MVPRKFRVQNQSRYHHSLKYQRYSLHHHEFKPTVNKNILLSLNMFCLYRKFWQANIASLTEETKGSDKIYKVLYKFKEKKLYKESFIQSLYKERDSVYIIG